MCDVCDGRNENSGINIEGEHLNDLRFADDVALCMKNEEEMEQQLNKINRQSKEIGLKIHKGKTQFMTNFDSDTKVHIENEEIKKVSKYKYLGQNTVFKNKTKEEKPCMKKKEKKETL